MVNHTLDILGGAALGIGVSAGLTRLENRNPFHRALDALFGVLARYHLAAGSS